MADRSPTRALKWPKLVRPADGEPVVLVEGFPAIWHEGVFTEMTMPLDGVWPLRAKSACGMSRTVVGYGQQVRRNCEPCLECWRRK